MSLVSQVSSLAARLGSAFASIGDLGGLATQDKSSVVAAVNEIRTAVAVSESSGQPRFAGSGPPGVIIGANPGDEYLDNTTGDIYRLS